MLPHLGLDEAVLMRYANEHYSVIATNADQTIPIEEIIRFYRQRGDTSKNRIKEPKKRIQSQLPADFEFSCQRFLLSDRCHRIQPLHPLFKDARTQRAKAYRHDAALQALSPCGKAGQSWSYADT